MTTTDDLTDDGFADQVRRAVRALPDAPLALQRRASALWPQTGPLQAVGHALRRIAAVLAFDSWAPAGPALAMRSAASTTRHLMFNAEGRDVDLRIAPGRSGFTLSGQVLGPDSEGEIELLNPSANVSAGHAALDDLGGFRLDGVGQGVYRLTLRVGGDQIELPPLDVGAPPR
jgi:hypothetical protein